MFEVSLGANLYFVKFNYPDKQSVDRRKTVCKIFRVEDDGKYVLVAVGYTVRYYKDKFNPHLGRKFALKNALEAPRLAGIRVPPPIEPRYRWQFWKEFFADEQRRYKTSGYNILA